MEKENLSTPQKSIWYTKKMADELPITNIGGIFKIKGYPFDAKIWEEAVNMFIANNDATRIRIVDDGEEPMQYFAEHQEEPFETIDLSDTLEPERQKLYKKWMQEILADKLYTNRIIKYSENESGIFSVKDHIATDGFSIGLEARQLRKAYINLLNDKKFTMEKSPSYSIFLDREEKYRESDDYTKDKSFWEEEEYVEKPVPSQLSVKQTTDPAATRYSKTLDSDLTKKIKAFLKENNMMVARFFESLLFTYIKRILGEEQQTIGVALLNRKGKREKGINGMLVNTLPMSQKISNDVDFESITKMTLQKKKELFWHQRYPYFDIQEYVNKRFDYKGKLFDIVFSYQNASIFGKDEEKIEAETEWIFSDYSPFGLTINLDDRDEKGEYLINIDYQNQAYSLFDIDNLFSRLSYIAAQVIENKNIDINDINIMTAQDIENYNIFNGPQDIPVNGDIVKLFEEQVKLNPNKVALIHNNEEITYEILNDSANSLAHKILSYKLPKDAIIPIVGERHSDVIIAMLAVAKAGHTYFLIDDSKYPEDRIHHLINECGSELMIKHNGSTYVKEGVQELDLQDESSWTNNISNPGINNELSDGFCVLHTSGSTGLPKCALLSHGGLANMAVNNPCLFEGCDYGIDLSTMSFDAFLYTGLMSLLNGKTMVLTTAEEQESIKMTEELVAKYPNSFSFLTPTQATLHMLDCDSEAWKNIVRLGVGGEAWGKEVRDLILSKSDAKLFNIYGPTECCVFNIINPITSDEVTLGRPSANFKHYVVDKNNRILPPGAVGEIVNVGIGVGIKYVNQEKLTNEKFIILPETGERAYKTGDLGYIDENLEMRFLGRRDFQVKINGLRIELEEIESVLKSFDGINMCAVVVKKHNNEDYLAAYYTSDKNIKEEELRNHLGKKLAYYMVPSIFLKEESMPLTTSGKISRTDLPEPDFELIFKNNYKEPETKIQKSICAIWEKVLGKKKIGINTPFFNIGTSHQGMRMKRILEDKYDIKIKPKDLPGNPTVKMIEQLILGVEIENTVNITEELDLTNLNVAPRKEGGNILLTGSTGYLGSHILHELLTKTDKKIYCLIRSPEKFDNIMQEYFKGGMEPYRDRIQLIVGDISQDNLGLEQNEYDALIDDVSEVVNSAANVKHYSNIEDSIGVNITGVKNLLDFCAASGAKYHHMSTLSVSGIGLTKQNGASEFTEDNLDIGQRYEENQYVWTKYIAELYIEQYKKKGVSVSTYRFGGITERSTDGLFQFNEEENGIKAIANVVKELGVVSRELEEMEFQIMEVDKCAEAVVSLMNDFPENAVYHVYDPKYKTFGDYLSTLNIKYQITDYETFVQNLKSKVDTLPNFMLVEQYLDDFADNLANVKVKNEKTLEKLLTTGFSFATNESWKLAKKK